MSVIGPVMREATLLREQATARLRDAILTGGLQPGQKLIERELCSALDISRSLLREVLPQLQAEGLVKSVAHKGPFVALTQADDVREIYQVRRVLEALAVREFTRNASDQQVRDLRKQLSALKQPEAASSLRNLLLAKAGFYSVLLEGCGNRVVNQTLKQLNNRMVLYKRLSLSVPGRLPEAIKELEGIVSAIEARDPDKASALCDVHVLQSEQNVMRQLADEAGTVQSRASRRARTPAGAARRKVRRRS